MRQIKKWTISLLAGSIALLNNRVDNYLLVAGIVFLIIAFWFLDAYYLWQERLFRKLYEDVIRNINSESNLRMSTSNYDEKYRNALFSITECCVYVPLGIIVICIISIL